MEKHLKDVLQAPPQWGMNVGSLGKWLVLASLFLFALSFAGYSFNREKLGIRAFWGGCLGLLGTFAALGQLMVGEQYQYKYVFDHTDHTTEYGYRIAAIWSGQEGSF
ncbi:MAG: hypothetical protein K8R88_08145, partial [Armatimonadetes bacterium]|nr:hypothetical protein [Armatimonadota bacterium]